MIRLLTRLAVALPLAAGLFASANTTAVADTLIADSARATPVTAHAGRVVWSRYDPAVRAYSLMVRTDGQVSRLPVPHRRVPFDADLGPDARGRPTLVYSRCRREPRQGVSQGLTPDRRLATGCDLYVFDLRGRRERRLHAVSTVGGSEYLPSVWGDRIAFVRVHQSRRGVGRGVPYLYVHDRSTDRTRRLPGGPRGAYEDVGSAVWGGAGPGKLDLRARRLAVGWESWVEECQGAGDPSGDFITQADVWLVTLGGRRRLVERGCAAREVYSPTLTARAVHYAADQGRRIRSAPLRSGPGGERTPQNLVQSLTGDGTALLYSGPYPRSPANLRIGIFGLD